jgi:hypothetical protein
MAFVFEVETGTGSPTANSYVSVAEADDYYVIGKFAATWTALTTAEKEAQLALASRTLDQKAVYYGSLATTNQVMRWPRKYVCDVDHKAIPENIIPRQLKDVVLELAIFLINEDLTQEQDSTNIKRIMADVVEIEYQDDAVQRKIPSFFNQRLHPLGRIQGGTTSFATIVRT